MRYRAGCLLGWLASVAVMASEHVTLLSDEPFALQQPYQFEQIRAWHQGWSDNWPWGEQEYALQLRDDNSEQRLLAIGGYARGGEYVLFLKRKGLWQASAQRIELAHHPVQVLSAQREGWREFETYVPAWGSGGTEVWVFRYRWNGHDYEQAEQRDASWCELHYFRTTAADLCTTP